MAPFLRTFFLAAVILCLSSPPGLAMFVGGTTTAQTFEPIDWPLTNYPCQKPPAEDAACLIDEIMRYMSANTLKTQGDKWIFDQFVRSVAVWGTAAQKEQAFDSLVYIPQHLMQIEPKDLEYYQPETAKEKQQYQKMILLLSLGKIDTAVDFLKYAAKTTPMPRSINSSLQMKGIKFLLETQTADTAYDFAQKTAKVFYALSRGIQKPARSFRHPLAALLKKQLHDNGWTAGLKIAKLAKEDNFYSHFSVDKDLSDTLASYAIRSSDPSARSYYGSFCEEQGAQAEDALQKIPTDTADNTFVPALMRFSTPLSKLNALHCFKDHPDILQRLADAPQAKTPPPEEGWHGMAATRAPSTQETKAVKSYQSSITALQRRAETYKHIETAYHTGKDPVTEVPQDFLHDAYYWAANLCPTPTKDACLQDISTKYRSHYAEKIQRTVSAATFRYENIEDIQYFIMRFNSALRVSDFIDPKKIFDDTSPIGAWRAALTFEAIKAQGNPETIAIYMAEKTAFDKKSREAREVPPVVHIFQTTPPDQISAQLAPWYEKTAASFYIDTVLPQLDAGRFDIVKDKFWQIYTHRCVNNPTRALATASRPEVRYALCLQQALTIARNNKNQNP